MADQNASLQIKLALQGQAQVMQGISAITGVFRKLGGIVTGLAPQLAGLLSVGAFAHFTKEAIEAADQMGKLAQKTGVVVESLSTLSHVAKLNDVDLGTLQVAMRGLAKEMVATGQGTADSLAEFLRLADVVKAMPDGFEKINFVIQQFGRRGIDLIPMLNRGGEAIRKEMEEAKEFGLQIGPRFAANAETFNDNLKRFSQLFHGMFLQLADALLPEFIKFQEVILDFIKSNGTHMGAVDSLIQVYSMFAQLLAGVRFEFEALGAFLGSFFGALSATGDPFKAWAAGAKAFDERAVTLEKRITQLQNLGRTPPGSDVSDPASGESKLSYEERKKGLELQIQENRYITEKYRLNKELDPATRQRELNGQLLIEIGLIEKKRQLTADALAAKEITPDQARTEGVKDKTQLLKLRSEITPETIGGNISLSIQQMQEQFGTFAQQIGQTFTTVIGGAINTVSEGITGLIMGTKTWGQALSQIGTSILGSVINAIVRMFVTWIVNMTILRALQALFGKTSNAEAASAAAAWAPAAVAASIASYGSAATIGTAAAIAGMAVGTAFAGALSAGGGAFAEGGRPPLGQISLVGERGPELFVPDMAGTIVPADQTANMMRGGRGASPVIHVHSWPDEGSMMKFLRENPEADHVLTQKMNRNFSSRS